VDLDVPAALRAFPLAIAEWRRVSEMLRKARAITEADQAALMALCLEWSRYLEAMAKIAASGMVILSPSGYPMQNPYLPIATKALAACTRLWPELGMTPSARTRVVAPPGDDDPFAAFDTPLPVGPPPRPQ
jgi:P27 family predicted phage terminase small subunit